jgi:hypothetical protein
LLFLNFLLFLDANPLLSGTSGAAKLLRANGISLLKVREEAANVLGKSEMFYFSPMHPPLTEAAQRALDWAVNEKMKSGKFCLTYEHPLLSVTHWFDMILNCLSCHLLITQLDYSGMFGYIFCTS